MSIGGLLGQGLQNLGQYHDPYQELMRQQMMQGMRPVTREEYEKYSGNAPAKAEPKKDDEKLLLLTEEE